MVMMRKARALMHAGAAQRQELGLTVRSSGVSQSLHGGWALFLKRLVFGAAHRCVCGLAGRAWCAHSAWRRRQHLAHRVAACFETGDHVLGIAPGTSVAATLLGPHDDLAALLQRVHAAVEGGVAAKGAKKLVRMLTLEAGRLRGVAALEAPSADAARRLAKLDAALQLLSSAAARFNRVDGGSAAAAGAADATSRLLEAAAALPDVAAIVTTVLEDVAAAARYDFGAEGDAEGDGGHAARRERLLPPVAMALYFLGIGVNSFDFVADMELGATVFLVRDASGVPHWRYVPPFLLGVRPRPPACVALPSRAQALVSWLVATMPGPTPHLFGLPPCAEARRR